MTRDETVGLWQKCEDARAAALTRGETEDRAHEAAKSVWNLWARELVHERGTIESTGAWRASHVDDPNFYAPREVGANSRTREWLEKAAVDFSQVTFVDGTIELTRTLAKADSKPIAFGYERNYRRTSPSFRGFQFPSLCDFWEANFATPSDFSDTIFHGLAGFRRTTFADTANFERATFHRAAWFARTRFASTADFDSAVFMGWARYAGVMFEDAAIFRNASFQKAFFRSSSFSKRTDFDEAIFDGDADFSVISVNGSFDMNGAKFSEVPSFSQSSFREAPDFDNVTFPLPRWWGGHRTSNIANYRHLRRLAIQGHDHENEAKAFKGEVRSKRGAVDKPWHAAFWFGILYDALSDFGRSMMRPFHVWLLSVTAFATIYFVNAGVETSEWLQLCASGEPSKALKSLTLSAANALPLIGSSRGEIAKSFYDCIGLAPIPAWSPIIQIGQTLWSSLLIFLFLLAVRNQFKIK
jgi:uncharacterized protein YjbI with pentapeptide repeats